MIVYDKRHKKYILSQQPISQDYDGAIYSVPSNPDILVKIYETEYRTSQVEKEVIDAANGTRSMSGERPVDIVYTNGRFAGYTFEVSIPVQETIPELPLPPVKTHRKMSAWVVMLLCIILGAGLSLLIYFVGFEYLESIIGGSYCHWNFDGVPMIFGGWIAMIFSCIRFNEGGAQAVLFGLISYLVGAVLVFGLISLLVWLVTLAIGVLKLLVPIFIMIFGIVLIVKSVFKR